MLAPEYRLLLHQILFQSTRKKQRKIWFLHHQETSPKLITLPSRNHGQSCEDVLGERSGYIQQELVLHVLCIQVLFQTVHEIDKDPDCREIEKALMRLGCSTPVPAIFVGGKLMGSTTEAMSMHLSGSLVPLVISHDFYKF
ncbi:unnamed protein product [Brassica oleracea]